MISSTDLVTGASGLVVRPLIDQLKLQAPLSLLNTLEIAIAGHNDKVPLKRLSANPKIVLIYVSRFPVTLSIQSSRCVRRSLAFARKRAAIAALS